MAGCTVTVVLQYIHSIVKADLQIRKASRVGKVGLQTGKMHPRHIQIPSEDCGVFGVLLCNLKCVIYRKFTVQIGISKPVAIFHCLLMNEVGVCLVNYAVLVDVRLLQLLVRQAVVAPQDIAGNHGSVVSCDDGVPIHIPRRKRVKLRCAGRNGQGGDS